MLTTFMIGGLLRWTSFLETECIGVADEMEKVGEFLGLPTPSSPSVQNRGSMYG